MTRKATALFFVGIIINMSLGAIPSSSTSSRTLKFSVEGEVYDSYDGVAEIYNDTGSWACKNITVYSLDSVKPPVANDGTANEGANYTDYDTFRFDAGWRAEDNGREGIAIGESKVNNVTYVFLASFIYNYWGYPPDDMGRGECDPTEWEPIPAPAVNNKGATWINISIPKFQNPQKSKYNNDTPNINNTVGFAVYRSEINNSWTLDRDYLKVVETTYSEGNYYYFNDTNLSPGITYYYAVAPIANGGYITYGKSAGVGISTALGLISHDPIYIEGNADFSDADDDGVSNPSAAGTPSDPYIIENWDINASSTDGIVLRNVSIYFVIKNCYVHNGGVTHDGIVFYNVTNGTIEYSTITMNRNGIMFRQVLSGKQDSDNNTISHNNIIFNTNDGINFEHIGYPWHSENVISYNNISNNGRGVYMIMSESNVISYNNIISNDGYGIHLDMCMGGGEHNLIHHNNFIDNGGEGGQACEWGNPLNYWNTSTEGNYWSDFDEPGEGAWDNNTDGIADSPHLIPSGGNQDNYPLMKPVIDGRVQRPPIYINGNANFTAENGVSNPGAAGAATDPYVIENWDIDASSADGIEIRDTDVYFIIRNCVIHDGNNKYHGIYFYHVTNGEIENATSYNNSYGIYLRSSSNNNITNCAVYNNYYYGGIFLYYSSNNNQITNCDVYNNYYDGIFLWYSSNNAITNCEVYNIYGTGIRLYDYSLNNIITDCYIYNNYQYGIELYSSSNNIITNCVIYNHSCWYGIYLYWSSNSNIANCAVYNNILDGIYLDWYSSNSNITKCTVYNNFRGITLYSSSNNEIHYCNIYNNEDYGVRSYSAVNATYNWWGSASGPGGIGPGNGDNISENVLYNPWLMSSLDFLPPTVVLTQPANGVVDVAVDAEIVITFSEPMNILTIPRNITIEPETQIEDYVWNSNNTTLTLLFTSNLSSYTNYTVRINTNVKDTGTSVSDGTTYYTDKNSLQAPYQLSFRTKDVTSPEIADIKAIPAVQEVHYYVNITCTVRDNAGVAEVCVNIKYPNGTLLGNFSTMSINLDANRNGTYYRNITYSVLGTYSYYIWANDTSNNQNVSDINTFKIQDTTRSEILNVQVLPEVQELYGYVNITCAVTDNFLLNKVYINITGPPGFAPINTTMNLISVTWMVIGEPTHYYNATYTIRGAYYFYIWANDTSNNQNKSETYLFEIDITKPEIIDIQDFPDPQELWQFWGYVNITCTVTDNMKVGTVKINISSPNGAEIVNATMVKIGSTNDYYYNINNTYFPMGISAPYIWAPGTYTYYIWANDTSNNQNKSSVYQFTIQDTTKPEISNISATPISQLQGGYVNITCIPADNGLLAAANVKVNITGPAGFIPLNISMIGLAGTNICYYNTTYSITGEYSYYIWAKDNCNNENKSDEYHFTIIPIVATTVDGKAVNITGIWTGTINITSVVLLPYAPPQNLQYIICINVTATGALTYANITIKYNDSDVAGIDESKLRMYYWDDSQWQLCNNTGIDTVNNIVWANVTHLTIFAPMAEKLAEAPAVTPPLNWPLYIGIIVIIVATLAAAGISIKRRKKGELVLRRKKEDEEVKKE